MFNSAFIQAWLYDAAQDGFRLGLDGLAMYCALDTGVKHALYGSTYAKP